MVIAFLALGHEHLSGVTVYLLRQHLLCRAVGVADDVDALLWLTDATALQVEEG